jgi:uncharacterized repeat protein (TIGR01451 family)
LADNGGPTKTHALVAGSLAIDAVTGACPPPAADQRGETRPQGAACDIGAFEVMVAPSPDLAVSKTDSPDPVVINDQLTYTLTVNNAGEGDASGVTLTDTLPVSVNFVSVTTSQGSCGEAVGVVTCNLGDLASGANAIVTLVVKPTATGTLTNNVTVESAETDENPGNNSDTEQTTVNPPSAPLCLGQPATIIGTPGDDTLNGTPGNDVIVGRSGNDRIDGRGGNDKICGNEGNDRLSGSDGNDMLSGDEGNDVLDGGNGNDQLDGGTGNDALGGGNGQDTLAGGEGNDALGGGAGNDARSGGAGNDALFGEDGSDQLDGGPNADFLREGSGFDRCINGENVGQCEA